MKSRFVLDTTDETLPEVVNILREYFLSEGLPLTILVSIVPDEPLLLIANSSDIDYLYGYVDYQGVMFYEAKNESQEFMTFTHIPIENIEDIWAGDGDSIWVKTTDDFKTCFVPRHVPILLTPPEEQDDIPESNTEVCDEDS